ncbi:Methyltransferase FkbM [Senna tora]|uniref:Methyltransferase FkbM n=1 Tax=Senna tora TaxID=362788 RepID=A0A834WUV2_9FABA|nr:Methyltransferase FkbM [Senna tora]
MSFFSSSLHFASSHHFLPETLNFVIASAGAGALVVESNDAVVSRTSTAARTKVYVSKDWVRVVHFYSSVFQDLISNGYLSPGSKSLCVEMPTGHDAFALKEIGVSDSIGISKKASKPLVKAGLAHLMPFRNNTFDFIIFTNHTLLGFSAQCDCIVVLIGGFGIFWRIMNLKNDNEIAKCLVLKKLGNNWRNYQGWLFHTFYEVQMSREHNLDNHPDFIPYDMWAGFVDYRLNPRTQEMESGGPVSRGAIFVATHKKRDGSFVNDEAKNICIYGYFEVFFLLCFTELFGKFEHLLVARVLIPLNYINGDTTNALQQEIVRLQSELESSNARSEASKARLEASNAQLKLEMRGVFSILKNIMGNVPFEFAHMINSEVPEASNGQSSSVGHSFSASEDHPNT